MESTYTFGKTLDRLLRTHNVTQKEIAKLCNLKQATISFWINHEDPEFYPPIKHLLKISRFFNMTIDELVGITNQRDSSSRKGYKKPFWVKTEGYEGFCLIDTYNRKFIGIDGFELTFYQAKYQTIKCMSRAPAEFYKLYGEGNPLRLSDVKELYIQSVIDEKARTVWVQVLDNGNISNRWMNGWYTLKEDRVTKRDINLVYTDYGARWIAFKGE